MASRFVDSSEHDISQMSFIIIEQIVSFKNLLHLDQLLLTREAEPIGWHNYSHLIRMALTKGGNFAPKIVLIIATNQTVSHVLASKTNFDLSSFYFIH